MFKNRKQKTYSTERIADLYLAELAKYGAEGGNGEPFLDDFLRSKNAYFDIEKLNGTIELLISKGLIEKDKAPGFSIFTYVPGASFETMSGPISAVPTVHITNKGLHHIRGGQELDENGRAQRAEESRKRWDKWVSAGISFGVSVSVLVVKWFFFDKK